MGFLEDLPAGLLMNLPFGYWLDTIWYHYEPESSWAVSGERWLILWNILGKSL
jgi:hypothetical protein